MDLEQAFTVDDAAVTGGAVDIAKCFDQILRPVVYKVAALAGMPPRVLESYRRYQESLLVRNSISGGLGQVYRKRTSIPQGDPFSMMFTALLMRAWIVEMRVQGARGRVLADDILVMVKGNGASEKILQQISNVRL